MGIRRATFPVPAPPSFPHGSPEPSGCACPSEVDLLLCPFTGMIIAACFGGSCVVGPTSLLSVMHESSKRVSETLQEIYSSEWDGHEELKAIVGVRVSRLPAPQRSLCPQLSLLLASPSTQIGKQRSQSASFMCVASVMGGSTKPQP